MILLALAVYAGCVSGLALGALIAWRATLRLLNAALADLDAALGWSTEETSDGIVYPTLTLFDGGDAA